MLPDNFRWQAPSTYDYVDDLDAPGISWEWLRRNMQYQNDYTELKSQTDETAAADRMASTWGLRFRGRAFAERDGDARVLASRGRHRCRHSEAGASVARAIEQVALAA